MIFTISVPPPTPTVPVDPCTPSPCGVNALCTNRNGAASCRCLENYFGDPYQACQPECLVNNDCTATTACRNLHCIDPCPGLCGVNAGCKVINHIPTCTCLEGYEGDPFSSCRLRPISKNLTVLYIYFMTVNLAIEPIEAEDPCFPNPCGPNSAVPRQSGARCQCSCLPDMIGSPPNCKPECVLNSDCSPQLACISRKCRDPCPGLCGTGAYCNVRNHIPLCVCNTGYQGDPFTQCRLTTSKSPLLTENWPNISVSFPAPPPQPEIIDPCRPSPCGLNAVCTERNRAAACSCLPGLQGDPYTECKPECSINQECAGHLACVRNKCRDPCPGVCGSGASCSVTNHFPTCHCDPGYEGDPFTVCYKRTTTCKICLI